jgi:Anti-sigma-K factor rskA, C-terminal
LEPLSATSLTSVAPVPIPERFIGDQAADPVARARLDLTEPVRLPPEGRLSASTLAILAAAAGVVAILLGGWAFVSGTSDDDSSTAATVAAPTGYEEALALLAAPNVERLPLMGSVGRIVLAVRPSGEAALVLNGLGEAESGWAYQAWVSTPGAITPHSAALFSGRESVVPLDAAVPPGAKLAVTLEPENGSFAPTRTPKLVVERAATEG